MCYDGLLQSNMQINPFFPLNYLKVSKNLYLLDFKKLSLYLKKTFEMILNQLSNVS